MKLLIATDLSESSEIMVSKAVELAQRLAAKIWLIHVADPDPYFVGYEPGPQYVRDSVSKSFHEEHRQLQAIADQCRNQNIDATALLIQGTTVQTIIKESEKIGVDMIIVGTHQRNALSEFFAGSVSKGILDKSKFPVLVIPTHK